MPSHTPNIAAILKEAGGKIVTEERKTPSAGANEIIIRNRAAAVNPIDWKRQSWNIMIASYPVILGSDVAGEVVEIGPGVTSLQVGDRVLAYSSGFITGNNDYTGFQTYSAVRSTSVAKIPDSMSFVEAATLPQGVATATLTLFDVLGLPLPTGPRFSQASITEGSKASEHALLVWGGSSSVGFQAIQIALKTGITVFATASKQHHEKLRELGVAGVVDYKEETAVDDLTDLATKAGKQITYAIDAITTVDTLNGVQGVLSKGTRTRKLAYSTFWPDEGVEPLKDIVSGHLPGEDIMDRRDDLAKWLFNEALPAWLEDKSLQQLPQTVVPGGLGGIQDALDILQKGVSGSKVVVEV
ncbi:GroES-like protein [Periconia macrospinosa]|uniref:GroES-like protein n=1 Tax=Periconia macrospinosa TaxID=97972 RepID=A0A2V1D9W3_9PLEO|nr:GroES-like protein [Periconia macrospinosa]